MEIATQTTPIRNLMPDRFTAIIAAEAHGADPTFVSKVVNKELTTSYIWPSIVKLAMQTDSKACRERIKFLEQRDQAKKELKQSSRKIAA